MTRFRWNGTCTRAVPTVSTRPASPVAPTNLHGAYNSGGNSLSWTASTTHGVTYNIYRGWVPGGESLYKTGITATSFHDQQNQLPGIDYG